MWPWGVEVGRVSWEEGRDSNKPMRTCLHFPGTWAVVRFYLFIMSWSGRTGRVEENVRDERREGESSFGGRC